MFFFLSLYKVLLLKEINTDNLKMVSTWPSPLKSKHACRQFDRCTHILCYYKLIILIGNNSMQNKLKINIFLIKFITKKSIGKTLNIGIHVESSHTHLALQCTLLLNLQNLLKRPRGINVFICTYWMLLKCCFKGSHSDQPNLKTTS